MKVNKVGCKIWATKSNLFGKKIVCGVIRIAKIETTRMIEIRNFGQLEHTKRYERIFNTSDTYT